MQQSSQDQSTLLFRIETLERMVRDLQAQLQQYVRSSENNLHIQAIRDTVERIEKELGLTKQQLTESSKDTSAQLSTLREEQNKIQIKTLTYIVGTVVTFLVLVLVGIIIAYYTHAIH